MRIDKLTRNDLSTQALAWYLRYLEAIDSRDLNTYSAYLADDCIMYMNNAGPIAGKSSIIAMLGPYWSSFAGMEHDLLTILGDDREWMLEALNHYDRHDGGKVTVRAVAITRRRSDGLVDAVRIFTDPSPVFAPEEVA